MNSWKHPWPLPTLEASVVTRPAQDTELDETFPAKSLLQISCSWKCAPVEAHGGGLRSSPPSAQKAHPWPLFGLISLEEETLSSWWAQKYHLSSEKRKKDKKKDLVQEKDFFKKISWDHMLCFFLYNVSMKLYCFIFNEAFYFMFLFSYLVHYIFRIETIPCTYRATLLVSHNKWEKKLPISLW